MAAITKKPYQLAPAGDSAILITFQQTICDTVSAYVSNATRAITDPAISGVTDVVPAFCSVLVCYDPAQLTFLEICGILGSRLENLSCQADQAGVVVTIPVCYGGDFGPDIEYVARHANLTVDEVIAIHTQPDYPIAMLGFLPGFAYLSGLDERLHTPRLETPRVRIDAGAVGIGGAQTGIYPMASPAGWQLIGNTPLRPWDPNRDPAFLYAAGDRIRFTPITPQEYEEFSQQIAQGTYQYQIEPCGQSQ